MSSNNMAVFTLNPVIAVITYPSKISDTNSSYDQAMRSLTICNQNPNSSQNHIVEKISFNSPDKNTSGEKMAIDMTVLYWITDLKKCISVELNKPYHRIVSFYFTKSRSLMKAKSSSNKSRKWQQQLAMLRHKILLPARN